MSYHESPHPGRTDITQLSGQAGLLCWTGQEFSVAITRLAQWGRRLRFSGAQPSLRKTVLLDHSHMGLFTCHPSAMQQCEVDVMEAIWTPKSEIFTIWAFIGKVS